MIHHHRPPLRLLRRTLSSLIPRGEGICGQPPLSTPFHPSASLGQAATAAAPAPAGVPGSAAQISTLESGVRVASIPNSGGMAGVGVVMAGGARYEAGHKRGVSHFLEKLSFSSTEHYGTSEEILGALEPFGGMYEAQHFRDVSVFNIGCLPDGVDTATHILSQVLFNSTLSEEEVEAARQSIQCERIMYTMGADQEVILTDQVHAAGFRNNTVGFNKVCPESTLTEITRADVLNFYRDTYLPSRMVLVGVGVDHDTLVESAKRHFPAISSSGEGQEEGPLAEYTGGFSYHHDDTQPPNIGPQALPTLTHLAIGFPSSSHQDDDYVAFCVWNCLMGGGGSFSAGGPGKGMYTRLYLQVLNRYHWMYSALALNHPYQDCGLFTINASSHPDHGWDLTQVVIKQFLDMSRGNVSAMDFVRAKTQLKSTLLMNLEYRNIVLEDIGRQVLASGTRRSAAELCSMIDAVSLNDLQRLSKKMLDNKPAVGAYGDLQNVPDYDEICNAFSRDNGELTSRKSHFLLRAATNFRKSKGIIKSS